MQLLANNARALLTASILASDTSLTVEAGKADLFPVGNTGDWLSPLNWFKATLEDSSGNNEIVHVGTRTSGSGVFSVLLRGQDGTTALAFAAGSVVEVRYTKADAEAGVNALLTSLQKTGGVMTGALALAANAANPMEAVPKQQMDALASAIAATIADLATTIGNAITASAAIAAPTGEVCGFYRTTAPTGWLKANGVPVLVATYPALTAEIYCGDANNATATVGYRTTSAVAPSTNRSTTGQYIVLPDHRGEFTRGLDDGRGVDAGRVLGSAQTDMLKAHAHGPGSGTGFLSTGPGGASSVNGAGNDLFFNGSTASTGGTETRPRNVALLMCIKT
jgi:hypothetical protein